MGRKTGQHGNEKSFLCRGKAKVLIEYTCPKCGRFIIRSIEGVSVNCIKCNIWVNEELMRKNGITPRKVLPLPDGGNQMVLF